MSIKGQEMELALGLPIYLGGFVDNGMRKCYPYTLENLFELQVSLSCVETEDILKNFEEEKSATALVSILQRSFKLETEEELKEFLGNLKAENFKDLIDDIKKVNGIEEEVEQNPNTPKNKTDWMVSFCAINSFTATPFDKIKDLTLNQFQALMEFINKEINWNYKINTISNVKDPKNYISEDEHLLAPRYKKGERKLHYEDIKNLMKGVK